MPGCARPRNWGARAGYDLPRMSSQPNSQPDAALGALPPAVRETEWRVLLLALALLIAPLIVLCEFIAVWRVDVVDDQMFAYYGWRIANGATVYLDVWDNKPPGIYWINALGMLIAGGSYAGIVILCTLALLSSFAFFLVACASIYFRTAAAFTTVLLSFYLMHGYYTGGTNRTETFLVAFELGAVALYFRGWARDQSWKWLAAGACCGCAFLFKQVGLAAWGAMLVHLLLCTICGDLPLSTALRRAALLVGGCATVVAIACGVLAAQGALYDAWFATFAFNRGYFAVGQSQFPFRYSSQHLLRTHLFPILTLPFLLAIASVIHAALWRLRPALRPAEIVVQVRSLRPAVPRFMAMLLVWWAAAMYGAVISPHAFRHYLVPTIPPLLMIAGYVLSMMVTEQRLLHRLQQRAWVAAALVAMGWFALDAVKAQLTEFGKVYVDRILLNEPASWEPIGAAVRRVTGPQDRIQCWGYHPGVYLTARRINACRFTTTEKIGQVGANAAFVLHEIEHVLRTEPPVVIAMDASDYEWIQGRRPEKSDATIGPWMAEHYAPVIDVAKFNVLVFKRRDLLSPPERELAAQLDPVINPPPGSSVPPEWP